MKIAMFGVKGVPVPAGAEVVAEQIGRRLVRRGHQVTIYVRPHYTPRGVEEYQGIRLVHLPSIANKNLDAITHSFLASLAVLRERPDLVHIHGTGSSIFALHPRLAGIPTLVQSHGLDWQRAKWGPAARLYLRLTDHSTVAFPSATTAVSRQMTDHYQRLTSKKVHYIPNGIEPVERAAPDLIRQYGLEGDDYILFAARLVPEKGAHLLVEAYQSLALKGKKLVIAGDDSYGSAYVRDLKARAGGNVLFPGFVQGRLLHELLSNASLFVLPSEIEGMSMGLLEAMNYGSCVLVSDIPENLDVTGPGGNSFRKGSAADLARQLGLLLADEERIQAGRRMSAERVRALFDWETITDQFEQLYNDIIQKIPVRRENGKPASN